MMNENFISMISYYFKLDEEKFKSVVNNIDGMNINSVDDIKNLDSDQLQTLFSSLKDAYGELSANETVKAGLNAIAGKFFK